jgi:outer membrane protein assembly factor BamD (BamD/ComL family)
VPDAQRRIASLKTEEARGNYRIAQYYEKGNKLEAARIYYNAAYAIDSTSPMGIQARQRIEALKAKTGGAPSPGTTAPQK